MDEVDAHHARDVAAGAEIIESPVDQGYGVREYGARDPEGQLWFFHAPLDRDDLVVLDRAAVSQNGPLATIEVLLPPRRTWLESASQHGRPAEQVSYSPGHGVATYLVTGLSAFERCERGPDWGLRAGKGGRHRLDVKSLGMLVLVLVSLAIAAVIAGVLLLVKQTAWELELAKWLLTLGVGLVTAGAIAGVYKMMDLREGRSAVWRSKLVDVTGAYDAVLKPRMRMIAHSSARTYSLEMENLVGAREALRRTFPKGEVDDNTRAEAKRMWKYLEALGLEYQNEYFRAARRQRAEDVPSSVELRWRPGEHQAAFTW
ncbi:MAG TPA: hypothetical protein VIT65_14615 [Microlunatus sp.]